MNYRRIIALFGGEELDAWTQPVDEWILAIENKEWTPEFLAAVKKRSTKTSYTCANSVRYQKIGYDYKTGQPCDAVGWHIGYNSTYGPGYDVNFFHYYSKKTDVMVSIEKGLGSCRDKFLDHAEKLRDTNYSGDQRGILI